MAGSVNLLRNSKVYYTTLTKADLVSSGGAAIEAATAAAKINAGNTWEIPVQADFTFSQGTEQQTITLNEAGATPSRGQRSFNTTINPVDWSFSTYMRPTKVATLTSAAYTAVVANTSNGLVAHTVTFTAPPQNLYLGDIIREIDGTADELYVVESITTAGSVYIVRELQTGNALVASGSFERVERHTAPEALLWNALVSSNAPYSKTDGTIGATGTAGTSWTESNTSAIFSTSASDVNQFTAFGLIFKVDSAYYYVDNCVINQADMNFGIDAIASIAWSGQGATLNQLDNSGNHFFQESNLESPLKRAARISAAQYESTGFITNRLSEITLKGYNVDGAADGATQTYKVAITGGQLTYVNNVSYLTPEMLGAVNKPFTYFAGTRGISGNLTAYLKVGLGGEQHPAELLSDLAQDAQSSPDNLFDLTIGVGSINASGPKVDLWMPAVMMQIPSIDVQDVVSATINFTAQGSGTGSFVASDANTTYDIAKNNELQVKYTAV